MQQEEIIDRLGKLPGKIGFYYKNLTTDEEMKWNEDVPMDAASVIKLFVLVEAYRQMEEGLLDKNRMVTVSHEKCVPSCGALTYMHDGLEVTVEDLCTLMIILSDNTATNYMVDILGLENIQKEIKALGYTTTMLNRKMFDHRASAQGVRNLITASEVGDLLVRMANGDIVSAEASSDMIGIMKNQRLNGKIPFYIHALADSVPIAHKTGEDDGTTHDVGIIFTKQPFVVAFCGNETDVAAYEREMALISLELFRMNN